MKWHSIWLISTWILTVTGQVVHLKNQDEFIKNINQHDLVLVDFFAPSCHHCKALEPEYEQAASLLASEPLMLAKLDCTENESICSRYRVKAYPTLQLFRKGKASEVYRDEKTAEKMTEYMRK
jgi:protein disulfide-isomerase A1